MENGIVNLINNTPPDRYRHAIVALSDATDFRRRLRDPNVPIYELKKSPGTDVRAYLRLWRLLRELQPDILHTRSWGALDGQIWGILAGVRGRIHGEHGFNKETAETWKRTLIRRCVQLSVPCHTTVSKDLASYMTRRYRVPPEKVRCIYNGVDIGRFFPPCDRKPQSPWTGVGANTFVVGLMGRMQATKDPLTAVTAFVHLLRTVPEAQSRLRLMIIGEGPLRGPAIALLREAGAEELAWAPGEREDTSAVLRQMDVFVQPSLSEGMSNTILEAMATRLPVVATRVGGNPEIVLDGLTGLLVPPRESVAMAAAIRRYIDDPSLARCHGAHGRERVQRHFAIEVMVNGYLAAYDFVLSRRK